MQCILSSQGPQPLMPSHICNLSSRVLPEHPFMSFGSSFAQKKKNLELHAMQTEQPGSAHDLINITFTAIPHLQPLLSRTALPRTLFHVICITASTERFLKVHGTQTEQPEECTNRTSFTLPLIQSDIFNLSFQEQNFQNTLSRHFASPFPQKTIPGASCDANRADVKCTSHP